MKNLYKQYYSLLNDRINNKFSNNNPLNMTVSNLNITNQINKTMPSDI